MPRFPRRASIVWTSVGLLCACLLLGPAPAAAQSPRNTSASFGVSVTVVRSCSVSVPAVTAAAASPSGAAVRLSCAAGKQTSVPLSVIGAQPSPAVVTGAPAEPGLSTARQAGALMLSINF